MNGTARKVLSVVMCCGLLFQQAGFARAAGEMNAVNAQAGIGGAAMQPAFRPLHLRYFSYDSRHDDFKILLDKGDVKTLDGVRANAAAAALLKHFLVGIALPDDAFWVNLRPDAENETIDALLAQTDAGRIMLEADLQLKKDVAVFTSPRTAEGKAYWDRLYKKAEELYGHETGSIPTLTRPWIVPGEIIIREAQSSAYVYKATLKVMLEQDYLNNSAVYSFKDARAKALNDYSSQLLRELVIPKITKEVNSAKRYAALRQVYYSLILSRWFKSRFTGAKGAYSSLINSKNLANISSSEPWSKNTYVEQYRASFSGGEYTVQAPVYTSAGRVIRSYVSGGIRLTGGAINIENGVAAGSELSRETLTRNGILLDGGAAGIDPLKVVREGDTYSPIYYFGTFPAHIDSSLPKGKAENKPFLGGKGGGLAEMSRLAEEFAGLFGDKGFKLNVPPGFTVTTEQTRNWWERRKMIPDEQAEKMNLHEIVHRSLGQDLIARLQMSLRLLEEVTGQKFGDAQNMPLLIAVRSGAKESMPGMMDTVLNLGLNDKTVLSLAAATNERFAWDAYRRFIEMFGRTVLGVDEGEATHGGFKYILLDMINDRGCRNEYDLQVEDLKELVQLYKAEIARQGLTAVPEDPWEQYLMAVYTVMNSSFNERAMAYREKAGLKLEDTLSAVNILPMIFGNLNEQSGSGVAFSRDLQNGAKLHNLEFNVYCQGEDVVSGRKKGLPLAEFTERFPDVAGNLEAILDFLESKFRDVQDVEFTFENNPKTNKTTLWILQSRNAKRTARSEVKTAMDMFAEGMITREEAVKRVSPDKVVELLVDQFDRNDKKSALGAGRLLSATGLNASPGAGVGMAVLDSRTAQQLKARIEDVTARVKAGKAVSDEERYYGPGKVDLSQAGGVILVREETSPDDLGGMLASKGVWTARGGRTSHAAVVARQFGIPAVVGDDSIEIDFEARTVNIVRADGSVAQLREGDIVSLDGTGTGEKGQVFTGKIMTIPSSVTVVRYKEKLDQVRKAVEILKSWRETVGEDVRREYDKHIKAYEEHIARYGTMELTEEEEAFYKQYTTLQEWANGFRKDKKGLGVGANAEKPFDVLYAVSNGAENFGLVRTEHMFSGDGRELKFQQFILAKTQAERTQALKELLTLQQSDFEQIYIFADGRPVTIRLIDPPLHEFLPKEEGKIRELAAKLGLTADEVKKSIDALHEENAMFGTRGCRLSVLFPELIGMQTTAILNAARKVQQVGIPVDPPQIMVPLVGNVNEIRFVKDRIEQTAQELGIARNSFLVGTMIEIVAGAQNAAEIAKEVEFISFGTNDLTQGVLKISRDDGKEWLWASQQSGVFEDDPFVTLAPEVALFVQRVVERARSANPKIKIGICGEQGVDIKSIKKFLAPFELNYVSGSPRRVPGALFAAAQEAVKGHERVESAVSPVAARGLSGAQAAVTVRTDHPVETELPIGMIELESGLLDVSIRSQIQKFLLGRVSGESERKQLIASIAGYFSRYIGNIAQKGQTLSVRLPDLALETIFGENGEGSGISERDMKRYREANQAIGSRGMRAFFLSDVAPLYSAIAQGALKAAKQNGSKSVDFILPFIVNGKELAVILNGHRNDKGEVVVSSLREALQGVEGAEGVTYRFGAVLETPAACVTAQTIAEQADFLVVDARKLTEAVWAAFEKDARAGFFNAYMANNIWERDIFTYAPSEALSLIEEAVTVAWSSKPELEVRMITNSNDSGLISLARRLGVDSVIVAPDDAGSAVRAIAASSGTVGRDGGSAREEETVREVTSSSPDAPGGIDFRALPMSIRPMGSFSGLDFTLPRLSSAKLAHINIDAEIQRLKNLVDAGIVPSGDRIKELLAACAQKGKTRCYSADLLRCFMDICRLDEGVARESSPELREALALVDLNG